jgi:argininosuccinate lyase
MSAENVNNGLTISVTENTGAAVASPATECFPSPAYAANVLVDIFEDAKRLFLDYMIEIDCAHTVMLAEQEIITRDDAQTLLKALGNLDRAAIRAAIYDGSCEDLFFYIEHLMHELCGEDVAGKLHTARSRNDTDVTMYRMRLRTDSLTVIRATLDLRRTLLNIAAQHHDTLIPAYTHTQPAQPTTLAHYLLAMAEILGRDIKRLARAYDALNFSPLGACAITTTGFPINRARTAGLLGFTAPTVNSYASIAATDYFTELLSAISVLEVNIGKFAQEFLLWATREFNAIKLSDGYVQTSSIMPQKRNPVALEHVRALASRSLGQATAVFTVIHNTPFGDINDVEDDLQPLIANALRDAKRSVALFAAALSTASFNVERLRQRAGEDFTTVTELADTLVRREHLPFRVAHAIVERSVHHATQANTLLTYEILQASAREILRRELNLTADELTETLDPAYFVRIRTILGGCAAGETKRALDVERGQAQLDEEWYAAKNKSLADYAERLAGLCG